MREKPLTLCKYFAEDMKHLRFFSILSLLCLLTGCHPGKYAVFSGYAQGGTYTVKADLSGVTTSREEIGQDRKSVV